MSIHESGLDDTALEAVREKRRAYEPFTALTDEQVRRGAAALQRELGEWGSDRMHAQWARIVLTDTEKLIIEARSGAGTERPQTMAYDGYRGTLTPLSDALAGIPCGHTTMLLGVYWMHSLHITDRRHECLKSPHAFGKHECRCGYAW